MDLISEPRPSVLVVQGDEYVLHLKCSDPTPSWLKPVAVRLVEILGLPHNWDSYGAKRIDLSIVEGAVNVLTQLPEGRQLPTPIVVPTSEGGLQLEWHRNGIDLEIKLSPGQRVRYFLATGKNEEEGDVLDRLSHIQSLIPRLG